MRVVRSKGPCDTDEPSARFAASSHSGGGKVSALSAAFPCSAGGPLVFCNTLDEPSAVALLLTGTSLPLRRCWRPTPPQIVLRFSCTSPRVCSHVSYSRKRKMLCLRVMAASYVEGGLPTVAKLGDKNEGTWVHLYRADRVGEWQQVHSKTAPNNHSGNRVRGSRIMTS